MNGVQAQGVLLPHLVGRGPGMAPGPLVTRLQLADAGVSADDCIAADRAAKSLLPANMSRTPAVIASKTQRISSWTGWATPLAAASAARSQERVAGDDVDAERLGVAGEPLERLHHVGLVLGVRRELHEVGRRSLSSSPASGFGTMK